MVIVVKETVTIGVGRGGGGAGGAGGGGRGGRGGGAQAPQ